MLEDVVVKWCDAAVKRVATLLGDVLLSRER